jgi:phenylacetate-CoA ligase
MEHKTPHPELEFASREAIRALQWQRLSALLAKTWGVNAFFRDRWQKAGVDLDTVTDLESFAARVPTVDKAAFLSDQADAPPYGRRHAHALSLGIPLIAMTTSGTSGMGVEVHLETTEDLANHGRIYEYYFAWAGLRRADRTFLTMQISMLAGGRGEYHGAMDYGLSVFPVGSYDTAQRLDLIKRFRPRALYGTTSYFGHLAAVAGTGAAELGIETLLTGAEGASISWFERLERQFGARVADRYGLTQLGVDHMFTCEDGIGTPERPGTLHNVDPYVFLEVIDPASGRHVGDGEVGEIVLTSLYRTDVPMIRCRTGDRAIYRAPRRCRCGRAFSGVEIGTVGRLDDRKKIKGINVWPQAVDELLFQREEVDEYQVILSSDAAEADIMTVKVMPPKALSEEREAQLAESLRMALRHKIGIGVAVEVVPPGSLERSAYKARRWIDRRSHADIRHP